MGSTWDDILREIIAIQDCKRQKGRILWYRGHAKSDWTAKSSLHRLIEEAFLKVGITEPEFEKRQDLLDFYKTYYRQFKARAWSLLDDRERSEWGIILAMQHYGVPTRLLDWTESFACALFFAHCGRESHDDAAIYILDPEGLNSESVGENGLIALDEKPTIGQLDLRVYHPQYMTSIYESRPTIAVSPFFSNPRLWAQRGTFTITGDSFQPLEIQFGSDIIKKVILPAATFKDSQRFLDLVGMGHFGYFPDFVGLVNEIKESHNRQIQDAIYYSKRLK